MFVYIRMDTYTHTAYVYVRIYVCMYVYVCFVCYIYLCMYIDLLREYTYTHTYKPTHTFATASMVTSVCRGPIPPVTKRYLLVQV